MRVACFFLGVVAMLAGVAMCFYLGYVQWFVHPEYTRPMLFWAYWHLELLAGLGIVGGAALVTAGVSE